MQKNSLKLNDLPPLTNRGVTCATLPNLNDPQRLENQGTGYKKTSKKRQEQKTVIVLDWLQASCTLNLKRDAKGSPLFDESLKGDFLFTATLTDARNKNFRKIYNIETIYGGESEHFATIECDPYVSFIPDNTCIVKIENKFLYTQQLPQIFKSMLDYFGITFKYYNRVDIALDFERLNYRNLTPENFIGLIARDVYRLKGGKRGKIINDNDATIQKQTARYKGISWGSRTSGLKITMYNKSAEMRQKKFKPWIESTWKSNCLGEGDSDVWRLEFSLRKNNIASMGIDEYGSLTKCLHYTDINLIEQSNWHTFFESKYEKHFQIAIKGKEKQFCRMKKIQPFNVSSSMIEAEICDKKASDKMVRHRIKHMVKLHDNYVQDDKQIIADNLHEVVCDLVENYALQRWFKKEFPNIELNSEVDEFTNEQKQYLYNVVNLKQTHINYENK